MKDDHKNPPETVKEVGIHIGYLREDITDLKTLLTSHINNAALKSDVDRLMLRVDTLEDKDETSKYFTRLEGRAVSAVLGICIAVLTLWGLIRG